MTVEEVIDRLRVCISMGAIEGAVELLYEYANCTELAARLKQCEGEVVAWAYYGSPIGSETEMAALNEFSPRWWTQVKLARRIEAAADECVERHVRARRA